MGSRGARHRLSRGERGEKPWSEVRKEFKGITGKARQQIAKDYIGWPAISAGAFALAQLALRGRIDQPAGSRIGRRLRRVSPRGRVGAAANLADRFLPGIESTFLRTMAADALANVIRNVWAHAIIFCGHFPDQTYTFSEADVEDETRGGWYVRQLVGAANIEGSPLFHVISGNLGYQVEHHLYPDMPSSRYSEIAPKIKDICERYELPVQHRTVRQAVVLGAPQHLPAGLSRRQAAAQARPVPQPGALPRPRGASEASRFRERVPAEHPAAGPEHDSGGVEVQPPPRDDD